MQVALLPSSLLARGFENKSRKVGASEREPGNEAIGPFSDSTPMQLQIHADRPEPIMLQNLPIMLCCTAPKMYLLCSLNVPIMLKLCSSKLSKLASFFSRRCGAVR